ncbi:MAG: hypothetical protein AAF489_08255 [Bacteroidota bacterium]
MKKVKQLLVVVSMFLIVGSFTTVAQTGNAVTDAAKKEKQKLDKDKVKVKDKAKDKMKDKSDQVKGDAVNFTDANKDKLRVLNEKLEKASTDEERKKIKEEIAHLMKTMKKDGQAKVDVAKSDAQAEIDAAKNDANDKVDAMSNDDGSVTSVNDAKNNNASVKATELGKARMDEAKAKLAAKEKDLTAKEDLVRRGRARIASAKERLATAIANGDLTEDQIAKNQAKIDRAEAGIEKLEASIQEGKEAYARQKNSLSKVFDNKYSTINQ